METSCESSVNPVVAWKLGIDQMSECQLLKENSAP